MAKLPPSSNIVRVATTQYRVSNDIQANLALLLDYIDQAAEGGAQLVVAPEFGNHTSFYADRDQCWDVSIEIDGEYVQAVQQRAREKNIYVVFNATRRGASRPTAYITNFLIGADGSLIGTDDKQVLMGGEAENLSGSDHLGRVFETAIGRIGMMSCLDGVPPETARNLALQGAQIITNTHNSCALDEPYAHIPVRAAENCVWVIAAGKVGPICTDEMLDPLADMVGIPKHLITALGENPILDTQGIAVARLPCMEAGIIFADIDISASDNKQWDDGDLFKDRRPDLYGPMVEPPVPFVHAPKPAFEAAIVQMRSDRPFAVNMDRARDLIADAAVNGAQLVVLPELCVFDLPMLLADPAAALEQSHEFEQALMETCKEAGVMVAASLLIDANGLRHSGILIDRKGERVACYHQSHLTDSFKSCCSAGDHLEVFDTELGRIGIMLGYEGAFPEVAGVLARKGAELIVHPTRWRFGWEMNLALPERATENRVSILSAARADSVVERGGVINALSASQPLRVRDLNPIWPVEAPFDRDCYISARIEPLRSRNKDLLGFDLQSDRRPELYGKLVEAI